MTIRPTTAIVQLNSPLFSQRWIDDLERVKANECSLSTRL